MCQRPSPAPGYHSAGRFPSGRYRGGHRRQRLLPAGEAGAAPPVGVVLMRPQTQPAHRRLLIRHLEVQPDPRQRRQGFRPFAVHRQPQGSVSSEVHAPVADNHYLFAAQVVPAAVDEGFICRRCASHWTQCASRSYRPALFQRSTQALGSIRSTSLTPMSLSSGARINWSRRGSTAAPDRQPTSGSADPSGDRWSSIANRRGSARPHR